MFQKFFLFACVLAVMAVVYTNSAPTEDEPANSDEPGDQWQNFKELKAANVASRNLLKIQCQKRSTGVTSIGANNGELIYLDRHAVACFGNEFLQGFRFIRSGDNDAYYSYTCCHVYL
ncbi:hypothetical protein DAPPUDRAFT_327041 [Daphnia pulex]|uniref:Uncharacterized protein n=1 Tax=Daphnia pulex TaxID=6669 RepID=E9H9J4_DAPPU|nr:hypothetical protein DAPPUDRAFT_327041 [Daphnia pulex]|eukprot:EFX71641.1 hypothetical protein DAPPUDRAFT_327041 [Daphnia pulex]